MAAAVAGLVLAAPAGAARAGGPAVSRTFAVRNQVTINVPDDARQVRVWLALPQEERAQEVRDLRIEAPYPYRVERDSEGSRVLYLEVDQPRERSFTVREAFVVTRSEVRSGVDAVRARPLTAEDRALYAKDLEANEHVVIDDAIRKLSAQIVGGETNPVRAARRIYDWVLNNVEYWVKDPAHKKASPVGSTTYCLTFRTGNCSDFESLYASLARAAGIPTRITYGSFLKPDLDGRDVDASYHCWAEFYAPGVGWAPEDVAVADLYAGDFAITDANRLLVARTTADGTYGADPAKVDYYFGNLDARRVVLSHGRDLILAPRQAAPHVNALPKAYVEVDGAPLAEGKGWTRTLTYRELH